ncbi:MAG: hypothetical protein ACRDNB_08085 [Gaiellaceae bacterium]
MSDHPGTEEKQTFSARAAAFLQTGTGLITAVATLLVAITGLVTAVTQLGGGADETPPAAAESVTVDVSEDPSDAELLARIPEKVRSTCRRSTDAESGSISAFNCTYRRIVGLQYNLFPSTADLDGGYEEAKARYGLRGSRSSCAEGNFVGEYRGDGSMFCFVGDDGVAAIVWSDPDVDVLTFAWRDDGKLPELYDAWKTGVGPER